MARTNKKVSCYLIPAVNFKGRFGDFCEDYLAGENQYEVSVPAIDYVRKKFQRKFNPHQIFLHRRVNPTSEF